MKITDLKKILKELPKDQLIKDIADLYRKNDFVKDYYNSLHTKNGCLLLLVKHKEIIDNEFFPEFEPPRLPRLSVAKKAITEFKKICDDKEQIAELMIFYVENGVKYTNCYGDINEQFYFSMESMYEKTLKFITDNGLSPKFKVRCKTIVDDTVDMGWGFHDGLYESYYSYFN